MTKGLKAKGPSPRAFVPGVALLHLLHGSPLAMLILLSGVGATASIVVWQKDAIWDTVGYGAIAVLAMAGLVVGTFLVRPRLLAAHWYRFIGLIFLGFTGWGVLGFLDAKAGALADASLGGTIGTDLIGYRGAAGVLRLVGLSLVGLTLLSPKATLVVARHSCGAAIAGWNTAISVTQALSTAVAHGAGRRLRGNQSPPSAVPPRRSPTMKTGGSKQLQPLENNGPVIFVDEEEEVAPPPGGIANQIDTLEILAGENDEEQAMGAGPPPSEPVPEPEPNRNAGIGISSYLGEAAGEWRLPAIEILDHAPAISPAGVDNESRARAIEEALASYNIEAKVVEINPGPAVTQFGVEPGWARRFRDVRVKGEDGKQLQDELGRPVVRREEVSRTRVKVDAIANLDKDLALALAASSIRIEAPIPGKSLVGIEVPNAQFEFVSMRGLLEAPSFTKMRAKTKLAVALGKGSGGDHEVADLTKMPHILIAGATGSGKSVSINALLASLLMQATPQELRLLLVDPKRVEMAAYNSLPHLLMPVITDVDRVVTALRWTIQEMDQRYKKFSAVGARNLAAYNQNQLVVEPLPYIVIAVDELADLMMAAPYDVEYSLTRLAQLGRATGIHLIVATQRPSVDVVTGLIKANFPTRMSFAVSSLVDSRTILDSGGAEKLLGKGDSLYLPQDAPKPKRVQGVFVSDREVERLIRAWNSQNVLNKPAHVRVEGQEPTTPGPQAGPEPGQPKLAREPSLSKLIAEDESDDPLYEQAKAIAGQQTRVSPSLLQRRLRIGYNKAKSLIEMLQEEGLVEANK